MAFSQPIQKGQVPLSCNLCETETKIRSKCIDCDLLICTKCRDKVHPKFKNAKDHRIVDIKDIGMFALEMDFTHIKCQDHTEQYHCLFCESCNQLVCPLCISKTHNGHCLIEIGKGYEIKLDRLKQAQVKVQSNLQEINQHSVKIEDKLRYAIELYRENKKNVQAQNIALKVAVDQFTEKMDKKVEELFTRAKESHESEQTQTNELKKKIENQMSMLEDIITAKDAVKVLNGGEKFEQPFMEKFQLPFMITMSQSTYYPGKITQEVFGRLGLKDDISGEAERRLMTGPKSLGSYKNYRLHRH